MQVGARVFLKPVRARVEGRARVGMDAETAAPFTEMIRRFEVAANLIFQSILSRQKESSTLAAIRDALLPKLLLGELRINGNGEYSEGR